MKEVIMKVPSFSADYPKAPIYVAELVRCKECRHWNALDISRPSPCSVGLEDAKADDFCSYGERSEKPNNSKVSEIPTGSERSSE